MPRKEKRKRRGFKFPVRYRHTWPRLIKSIREGAAVSEAEAKKDPEARKKKDRAKVICQSMSRFVSREFDKPMPLLTATDFNQAGLLKFMTGLSPDGRPVTAMPIIRRVMDFSEEELHKAVIEAVKKGNISMQWEHDILPRIKDKKKFYTRIASAISRKTGRPRAFLLTQDFHEARFAGFLMKLASDGRPASGLKHFMEVLGISEGELVDSIAQEMVRADKSFIHWVDTLPKIKDPENRRRLFEAVGAAVSAQRENRPITALSTRDFNDSGTGRFLTVISPDGSAARGLNLFRQVLGSTKMSPGQPKLLRRRFEKVSPARSGRRGVSSSTKAKLPGKMTPERVAWQQIDRSRQLVHEFVRTKEFENWRTKLEQSFSKKPKAERRAFLEKQEAQHASAYGKVMKTVAGSGLGTGWELQVNKAVKIFAKRLAIRQMIFEDKVLSRAQILKHVSERYAG